jgi:hypothetical protein
MKRLIVVVILFSFGANAQLSINYNSKKGKTVQYKSRNFKWQKTPNSKTFSFHYNPKTVENYRKPNSKTYENFYYRAKRGASRHQKYNAHKPAQDHWFKPAPNPYMNQ